MKAYTDIEQSKKLAEFLPLDSADMYYLYGDETEEHFGKGFYEKLEDWFCDGSARPVDIPCWSLVALLDILPDGTDIIKDKADTENEKYMCTVGIKDNIISTFGNNPIDACVEMILKLNELNLL